MTICSENLPPYTFWNTICKCYKFNHICITFICVQYLNRKRLQLNFIFPLYNKKMWYDCLYANYFHLSINTVVRKTLNVAYILCQIWHLYLYIFIYSWENAKLLLIRDNFMEEMMFFDKDHIPNDIFEELKTFVFNPLFDPDLVKQVSLSATNVCIWVHAVYKYAHIHRNMQPRLRNLLEHEDKFTQVC